MEIPYKIYLEESEMPKAWYNMRSDMKVKPAPLLNPGTCQPMTAEELSGVFCEELVQQELDDDTAYVEIPQEIRRQVFQDMVQCIQGDHVLLLAGQGVHAGDARVFVQQVPGMGNQRKRKIRRFQPLLGAVEQRCPQFGFQVPDHFTDALTGDKKPVRRLLHVFCFAAIEKILQLFLVHDHPSCRAVFSL